MTDRKKTKIDLLDEEASKELKDKAWTIQKLDMLYLTTGIALIAAFNLSAENFLHIIADWKIIIFFFMCIAVYDAFISQITFKQWVLAKLKNKNRLPAHTLTFIVASQPVMHVLFIICILSVLTGYATGYTETKSELYTQTRIQQEIETYIQTNNFSPTSYDEISTPSSKFWLKDIPKNLFRYEKKGEVNYELTFFGFDGVFGTDDDHVFTHDNLSYKTLNQEKGC